MLAIAVVFMAFVAGAASGRVFMFFCYSNYLQCRCAPDVNVPKEAAHGATQASIGRA